VYADPGQPFLEGLRREAGQHRLADLSARGMGGKPRVEARGRESPPHRYRRVEAHRERPSRFQPAGHSCFAHRIGQVQPPGAQTKVGQHHNQRTSGERWVNLQTAAAPDSGEDPHQGGVIKPIGDQAQCRSAKPVARLATKLMPTQVGQGTKATQRRQANRPAAPVRNGQAHQRPACSRGRPAGVRSWVTLLTVHVPHSQRYQGHRPADIIRSMRQAGVGKAPLPRRGREGRARSCSPERKMAPLDVDLASVPYELPQRGALPRYHPATTPSRFGETSHRRSSGSRSASAASTPTTTTVITAEQQEGIGLVISLIEPEVYRGLVRTAIGPP